MLTQAAQPDARQHVAQGLMPVFLCSAVDDVRLRHHLVDLLQQGGTQPGHIAQLAVVGQADMVWLCRQQPGDRGFQCLRFKLNGRGGWNDPG
jgi:hypothetical protein